MNGEQQPNKRLLVVDDEESVALTVSEVLRRDGYDVDTILSGPEAVERLRNQEYDIVLTDLNMESTDGISVLAELRRLHPLTVAVVLTGFASLQSAVASMRQGAYDYLIKPCLIDDLKLTITRGLEHRRLLLAEQESKRRLEGVNVELERRVDEQTLQLRLANEELRRNNAAKDVFLATLSHELRTPLTPIVGWSRVLLNNSSPAMLDKGLRAIERNALHQAKLIEDLLDISRIITGKLSFTPEPVDVRVAAEAAVEMLKDRAVQKSVQLILQTPSDPALVFGMQMRLEQILLNLLSNAIKFTESGGRVSVTVENAGPDVRIVVADTGTGISSEFLPHVFERFKQAEWFERRKHDGLGLGLSIVEGLVELHRGRIWVESSGIGKGSTFTVAIPAAAVAAGDIVHRDTLAETGAVLVIDESQADRDRLSEVLSHAGWRVLAAKCVQEGLEILEGTQPAAIVTGINRPELDGLARLTQFREISEIGIPVIAMSAGEGETRANALRVGFADYVAKTASPEQILASIRKLTSRLSSAAQT